MEILVQAMITMVAKEKKMLNKALYTATAVACGWAGAMFEVTRPFR